MRIRSGEMRTAANARLGTPLAAALGTMSDSSIAARLPVALRPLGELAYDLWWTWQPEGPALFRDVDPDLWDSSGRNPVKLLRDAAPARLAAIEADPAFLERLRRFHDAWRTERARPSSRTDVAPADRPIAYFCAEFGVDATLPIYSGGLGVLAGDVLKEASDMGIPMVGIGLFYRRGYFRQRLDRSGWQHEYWTATPPEELPLFAESPRVHLRLRNRRVWARIWRAQIGRVPLYLLDTDVPENDATSRWITSTLYVSDPTLRLMQYGVLAIGGVRALRALGIAPSLHHLNEGHASLVALELLREARERHLPFEAARDEVRSKIVFTTHTPVPAGNERYRRADIEAVLDSLPDELGVTSDEFLSLTRVKDDGGMVGVTELALRTSRSVNAVSKRHGEVARGMWQHVWPGADVRDVPITHVTNGVHAATWLAPPMRALLDRHLGEGWLGSNDPTRLEAIARIPDEEIWSVRSTLRAELVDYVRRKSVADRLARGETLAYSEGAAQTFDPNVLTIGFARRVASYKRLHLLIADPARSLALLAGGRVQIVMSGRAHPADDGAKELVKSIFSLKEVAETRAVYLEDYDLAVAHELVAGCDVWLNLPRPPLEASGTSGMKAALNGSLNLGVLDGWWCEAFEEGRTGWGIASATEPTPQAQDARDASVLYGLLEREVIPMFYDRDSAGIPRGWVRRVKASLQRIAGGFTTRRMLEDYAERIWRQG